MSTTTLRPTDQPVTFLHALDQAELLARQAFKV